MKLRSDQDPRKEDNWITTGESVFQGGGVLGPPPSLHSGGGLSKWVWVSPDCCHVMNSEVLGTRRPHPPGIKSKPEELNRSLPLNGHMITVRGGSSYGVGGLSGLFLHYFL